MDFKKELQSVLYHEIPITKSMGLLVEEAKKEIVSLSASLELNINHKQTAFGGSLNSLATLAGWSLIWIRCSELRYPCEIVIQSAKTDYKKAIRSKLKATCLSPNEKKINTFFRTLERRGKARLKLDVKMNDESVLFTGNYVVLKKEKQ